MTLKKTIAIVGATEKRGMFIAKNLARGNYRLLLVSEEGEKLAALRDELNLSTAEIETINCAKEACWEADIIIVATPYGMGKKVAEKIKEVATGKIVVSISNPPDSSYENLFPEPNTSAAEELQHLLPYSKVVKTLNTAFAENFASLAISGKTADTFIAGNNSDAVKTVSELAKDAGFNPFVVGDLSMSWAMERVQLLLAQQKMTNRFTNRKT